LDTVNDLNEDGIYEVAAIVGSLRKLSFNRGLLRAAIDLQPDGMRITEVPIGEVPLFNDDIENQGDPPAVQNLKSQILASDAVLLITPEYNQSVSGVMKNAIDWASRPYGTGQVLAGKPVAILGASSGKYGTARAQLDLRKMLPYLSMHLLPKPEIYVGPGKESFDEQSKLTDDQVRQRLREMLEKLLEWTKTVRASAG
jgi:chromate reductase